MAVSVLYSDRVKDSSTTTGTGNFTLSGTAPTGYVDFNTAFGTSTNFLYTIQLQSGADWEVGQGHLSASTTLVRDVVLASSNAGALTSFGAGTKDVFCDLPADTLTHLKSAGRLMAMTRGNFNP